MAPVQTILWGRIQDFRANLLESNAQNTKIHGYKSCMRMTSEYNHAAFICHLFFDLSQKNICHLLCSHLYPPGCSTKP